MTAKSRRLFSLVSLLVFSALLLGYLWWGKFRYDHDLLLVLAYAGGLTTLLVNHFVHRDSLKEMGIRVDNLRPASARYGLLTLALGAGVVATGLWLGEPRLERWSDLYVYAGWAALQQHLLQNFLRLRSQELLGSRRDAAAFMAAAIFGLYHLPNPPLMLFSFLGALAWCLLFVRIPNLIWAALSQAILSACLLIFFKYSFLDQFEVGKPGHRYEYYGSGVNVAGGYDGQGRPFVVAVPGPDAGVKARVKVFGVDGVLRSEWVAFKDLDFSGHIAAGDLGFGPGDEIVVAPGPGPDNPPLARIFDPAGKLLRELTLPLPDAGYGAWVSVGGTRLWAAAGAGPASPSLVVQVNAQGRETDRKTFDLGFRNSVRSVYLCADDWPMGDLTPRLLLWASPISVNPSRVFTYWDRTGSLTSFDALKTGFGANVAPLRLAADQTGLVMAPGPLRGYPSIVLVTDLEGAVIHQFYATADPDSHGSNVGAVDADGDHVDEVVVGEGIGPGRPSTIQLFRQDGSLIRRWKAF